MKITRFFLFYSLSLMLTFASIYPIFAGAPKTKKIAFTSDRDGNAEIYIMNTDGTRQTNLTRHKASDFQPVWSPTGTQILFASTRDAMSNLYLMDADGANVKKVFNDFRSRSAPAWSPDGRQISYIRVSTSFEKVCCVSLIFTFASDAPVTPVDARAPKTEKIVFSSNRRGNWDRSSML